MAKTLRQQLEEERAAREAAEARADAAEAAQQGPVLNEAQGPVLTADPGERLLEEVTGTVRRDLKRLSWETVAVLAGVLLIVLGAGYAVGAHEGSSFAEGKGAHLGHVMMFMLAGAFVAFIIGWIVNRCRPIRERAAPAADDSIRSIEEWRALRAANPAAPWTEVDARMSHAACLRFAASYLGFIILAAAGGLIAG